MAAFTVEKVFVIDEAADDALQAAFAKQESARQTGDQKERALGLIKAADALTMKGSIVDAMAQLEEAQSICNDLKFFQGTGAAMNVMTKVQVKTARDEEDLEMAMENATETLKQFKKLDFKHGEAAAYAAIASVHYANQKSAEVLKYAKMALTIYVDLGEQACVAEMYNLMSSGFLLKANTLGAVKVVEKAKEIHESLGNQSKAAACLNNIATFEMLGNDMPKAVQACIQARALYKAAGDYKGEASVMGTSAEMLFAQGMHAEGIAALKEIVTLYHKSGDQKSEASALLKLGQTFKDYKDYQKAQKVAEVALQIFMSLQDPEGAQAMELVTWAKNQATVEALESSIRSSKDYMHIPETLIVDPTLSKTIQSQFMSAMTGEAAGMALAAPAGMGAAEVFAKRMLSAQNA